MRVRPVASTGSTRVTRDDMILGGYLIPRNSFIIVPFDAVHHFAGNWPDQPHAFIPVNSIRQNQFNYVFVEHLACPHGGAAMFLSLIKRNAHLDYWDG